MKFLFLVFLIAFTGDHRNSEREAFATFYENLAYRWAPIHYQDTDNTNAKADYITRFNYDGNWSGTDNWDHLGTGNFSAYVYYSVTETRRYWFIIYAFYHPRDWDDGSAQEHENDLEGVLCIVYKNGEDFGQLEGMLTVAHEDFHAYARKGGPLRAGKERIRDTIPFRRHERVKRPKTFQEAKGHGVMAWSEGSDFSGRSNQDGIIYYPSRTIAEIPRSGNDREVFYKLIDLTRGGNFWATQFTEILRDREQSNTYAQWGVLKGDRSGGCGLPFRTCPNDQAKTPWGWDDEDDGPNYAGELALDPAAVADHFFDGGNFGTVYSQNKYIRDLRREGFTKDFLPRGWPKELNIDSLYRKLPQ